MTVWGVEERGPQKIDDDFPNGLQMIFHDNFVQAAPLTKSERIEAAMPEQLRYAALKAKSPHVDVF